MLRFKQHSRGVWNLEGLHNGNYHDKHTPKPGIGNCQYIVLRWSAGAELTLPYEPDTTAAVTLHHGHLCAVSAVPSSRSSSRHLIAVMLATPAATCAYRSSPLSAGDDPGCVG